MNNEQQPQQNEDDQSYTTATYLPDDHEMNNPDCSCAACRYPTN